MADYIVLVGYRVVRVQVTTLIKENTFMMENDILIWTVGLIIVPEVPA